METVDIFMLLLKVFFLVVFVLFWVLLYKASKANAIKGHKDKLILIFLFIFTGIIGAVIFLTYRLKKQRDSEK